MAAFSGGSLFLLQSPRRYLFGLISFSSCQLLTVLRDGLWHSARLEKL